MIELNKDIFRFKIIIMLALVSFTFGSCEEYPNYTFQDTSLPTSEFSISSEGLKVIFSNESSHAVKYLWDFGDGETSVEKNPEHVYATKNNYTVNLTASDNNGESIEFSTSLAVGFPMAAFTFDVDRLTTTFTNTSDNSSSFVWDFGDGETSTEENPVHLYAKKGDYTVSLKAIDGLDEDIYEESIFVPGKFIPVFVAPSFEIGSHRTDWDWNGASNSGAPTPPDGDAGAKFQTNDWIAQTLQVDPNENYTIKFWYVSKSSSLPSPVVVRVEILDAADGTTVLHTHETGLSLTNSAYVESTMTFNTASASGVIVKFSWVDVEFRLDLVSIE